MLLFFYTDKKTRCVAKRMGNGGGSAKAARIRVDEGAGGCERELSRKGYREMFIGESARNE